MRKSRSGSEISFLGMLLRPRAVFGAMIGQRVDHLAIALMVVAGMMLVITWADLWNLGRYYPTGAILSGVLLLGPVTGILVLCLMAMFGMGIGNLLDRRHRASWQYRVLIPPFPLKNLVWSKVLGAERLRRMFGWPLMRQYLQAWSWFRAILRYARQSVTGGKVEFGQLLACLNRSAWLFLPLGLAVWIAVNLLEANGFGAASEASPLDLPMLGLKAAFMAFFLWLWLQALRVAFELDWMRGIVAAMVSTGLGLAVVMGLVWFLTGMHLT